MTKWNTDNPSFVPVNDGEYPLMPPDYQHDPGLINTKVTKRERFWMGFRRGGKIGIEAGVVSFATTGDWIKSVVVGGGTGITAGGFKVVRETRKLAGKPSLLDIIKRWLVLIRDTMELIKTSRK